MKPSFAIRAYCLLLFVLVSFMARAQPGTDFTATPVTGCSPLLVSFSGKSSGDSPQWRWDLGNGTISFLQNPSVTYLNPGFYTIKLVVTSTDGIDSVIKTQFINVIAKPVVQFTASVTSGCYPLPIQFTDQSTAGNDSLTIWQWDFGDGFFSNHQNPLHIYDTSGNYNVSLKVTNSKGCFNSFSKAQYIQVKPGVNAGFSNNIPNICSAPVTINFQDSSTGTGPFTYEWLFGDGSGSSLQHPSHVYNSSGSYTVSFVVTNPSGCKDTLIKENAFIIGNVVPAFTATDQVCAGAPLIITNTSHPIPSSASWTFGDGAASAEISPVKIYTIPGTYQVKLIANFGSCLDSVVKNVTVIPAPLAAFTADDTTECRYPFTVNFTNQALNATSFFWDFGDSTSSTSPDPAHTYNRYGNFVVQLVVTGANGCTDTLRKQNYIKVLEPVAIFKDLPDSGCIPFTKYFSAATTSFDPVTNYSWDFGDGSTSLVATPTHIYTIAGAYTVKLVISTATGCTGTSVMGRAVVINSRPVAIFSATPRNSCASAAIKFMDQSTGNVSKWLWNFGDGSTSTAQNPQHLYNDTGYFDVQLVVWSSGCPDTVKYNDYIHINPPVAKFRVSFNCATSLERQFTNQSIGADEWFWDFGDSSTSTQLSPLHVYALPGTYIVSLLVRNHASGCDFTTLKTIRVVNVKATFFASDSVICKGGSIVFSSGLSLADVKLFAWDFGDGKTASSSTSSSVSHLYAASGNYTVRLITTDILGCIDTVIKPAYIRIDGPAAKFASSVPGTCLNNLVIFNDSSKSDNVHPIQTWTWNYGDSMVETLTAGPFQHSYTTPGKYLVTLKVTDSKGCTDNATITTALIISKPVAKITALDTASCPLKPVRFTSQSTGPGLTYLWNFGDGTTSAVKDPVHNYLADGIYGVSLFVRDQYGCTDSVTRPSVISIVTPSANFTMSDSFSTCPPLIVQFTNLSLNSIAQSWNFGDGTASTKPEPSHFYNYPGTYTVTLIITSKGGCTDMMKKNIVVKGPKGTFTYNPKAGCDPLVANFIANTQERISFIWDYNDGVTIKTTDSVIAHIYTNPGIYVPKMILVDANGCQVPITGKDTILVNGVTAKFSFLDKAVCDKGNVSFINSSISNDIITSFTWYHGDGGVSTVENPKYGYTSTGRYYPKLVVRTLTGCVDSMQSVIPVKVVSSPQINITSTSNGCTPLAVTFKGLIAVPDTSALNWSWVFGNGSISKAQNPIIQTYNKAGVFNATVVTTNSSGCADTATKVIEAYIIPGVKAGPDTTICNRIGTVLQASGAVNYRWSPSRGLSCINCATPIATPDSARVFTVTGTSSQGCSAVDSVIVRVQYPFKMRFSKPDTLCKGQTARLFATGTDSYKWSPAEGLDNSNIPLPVARPDTSTTYRVIGTDKRGCFKDTGFVNVKVYPVPTVSGGPDQTINVGQSIDLVPVISPDVTVVTWSPTGSIFRNTYPAISIKPKQTTDYTVEAKNGGGCLARDVVTVFVLCDGANVFLPNTFSPNGDGANDVFYPRGTGLFKIKMMRIFNRWGEVIFEKNNFNPNDPASGWDGTYKGVKSGVDVFVYMIDIICDNNNVLTYKGNIALIQ